MFESFSLMPRRILLLVYTLSPTWIIILDNFKTYLDGPMMMWLLSFLIFLPPMTLPYTLAHLAQVII